MKHVLFLREDRYALSNILLSLRVFRYNKKTHFDLILIPTNA